jgi:hypothetical protein
MATTRRSSQRSATRETRHARIAAWLDSDESTAAAGGIAPAH